jgi:outer membrane receptor protein involved in Fe transport
MGRYYRSYIVKNTRISNLKYAAAPLALGLALISTPSFAQDKEAEDIVVTGSRIAQPNLTSTSPLAVTTAEQIAETGLTRLEDVLNTLPQIEASQNAFVSNGATGTATLDLRGLGSTRTLVLVNGRRLQPGSTDAVAADINQIPGALVQRVDVTTGGASSVYGADAVAGVVNFIMKKDFQGIQLDAGMSYYMHQNGDTFVTDRSKARNFAVPTDLAFDGRAFNVDFAMGSDFGEGRGNVVAYATYRKISEVMQGDRDHSVCALNGTGTACGGSGTAPNANFYISPVVGDTIESDYEKYLTPNAAGTGFGPASSNLYNYAPTNFFQRPDERYTMGAFLDYEVSESFHPYMELMFMHDRSVAQIAESGTFFAEPYNFSCASGNPAINASQLAILCDPATYGAPNPIDGFSAYIGKRNVEGGGRQSIIQHDSFRILSGAKGDLGGGWSYDASLQFGQSSLSNTYKNDFLLPSVADAVNAGTYLIWQNGKVTPEFAQTLGATATRTGVTKEFIASAYVTGDLGFAIANDPIAVVFGAEYRNEVYSAVSDYVYEEGLLAGQGGPTPSVSGKYNVSELFSELAVPLLQGRSLASDVRLELGYRYSMYNVDGGASPKTHTYKVQLNWEVNDMLRIRGGYNRAARAPNAPELFNPQNIGLWGGADPCAGASPEYTQAQCALTGVSAGRYGSVSASPASQYNGQFGGNFDLKPEKADTWTAGFVLTPNNSLSLSIDYYKIAMSDVIGLYPAEQQIRDCATGANPTACSRIKRNASGNLWQGSAGYVALTNDNLGDRDFQGVDVAASARMPLGSGSLNFGLTGSYLLKKEYQDYPTGTPYDCAGTFSTVCYVSPDWRSTARLSYNAADLFSVTGKWRFISAADGSAANGATKIKAQSYFDLTLNADVNDNFGISIGANNILDKNPPLVGGQYASNGNTYAGFYDTLGRYVFAGISLKY